MSYSKHRKLRLLQSTRLNPSVKANNTPRNSQSATPIHIPILSVRSQRRGLRGTTFLQITADRLPGHTVVQDQEARVARHRGSTMAPVAIEATEEVGTTIGVEA